MITPFISRTGQVSQFVFENNGYRYEAFIDGAFNQTNNSENLGEEELAMTNLIRIVYLMLSHPQWFYQMKFYLLLTVVL